jgi:hypothetical protein
MVWCSAPRVYGLGFMVWGVRRVILAAWAREVGEEDLHRCFKKTRIRNVCTRLLRRMDTNSHGARPVHHTISMIKVVRTSRLSIEKAVSL